MVWFVSVYFDELLNGILLLRSGWRFLITSSRTKRSVVWGIPSLIH